MENGIEHVIATIFEMVDGCVREIVYCVYDTTFFRLACVSRLSVDDYASLTRGTLSWDWGELPGQQHISFRVVVWSAKSTCTFSKFLSRNSSNLKMVLSAY